MVVSKDAFIKNDDAEYSDVDIPAWGGKVRLKSMTGTQRDKYYADVFDDGEVKGELGLTHMQTYILALSLCDENGNLWFQNPEEGIEILKHKNAASLEKAYRAAMKLNGIDVEAIERAQETLELTQSVETGSASR